MKNSKPFPSPDAPDWLANGFLTAHQLSTCRTLFPGQTPEVALTFIDLCLLQTALTAPQQAITTTYLDQVELERFSSFSFAKRQLEWLGGRMAAKRAALSVTSKTAGLPTSCADYRIEAEASGRPYLWCMRGAQAKLPAISISHSHGMAGAVAVAGHSCGLDLQRITPKVISVRERFASSEERSIISAAPGLHGQDEATLLTLIWSAKEALRKAICCQPLLGFTEITLSQLQGNLHTGMIGHFTSSRLIFPLAPTLLLLNRPFVCALTIQ